MRALICLAILAGLFGLNAHADGLKEFHAGEVIKQFGKIAAVPGAAEIPKDTLFKVAFDIGEAAPEGELNRRFESAARLINMHAEAGLHTANTKVAIVVHGSAGKELLSHTAAGGHNPNAELIVTLLDSGVSVILCGQTAAYRGIDVADLLPGVELSLSAMTAHAILQQSGYSLNPF